jgi:hypothetical protein
LQSFSVSVSVSVQHLRGASTIEPGAWREPKPPAIAIEQPQVEPARQESLTATRPAIIQAKSTVTAIYNHQLCTIDRLIWPCAEVDK